ncbi:MAG: hypothetical protein R3F01_02195 [Lysobacteraceae bacterium]
MLVLPGMDGAAKLLGDFAKALQPTADVLLVDLPNDRVAGYDELADIIRNQLPQAAPYYLLGYSFSGPLAIRLAAEQPHGLAGLVLCCTFARTPRPLLSRFATATPLSLIPRRLQRAILFGLRGAGKTRKGLWRCAGQAG